ncbi:unnamed protein product (mitochondrion) [Plasmodiophora brassicae]|uniref:Uncharacterized protein n=1 Tax=Plasmodiophora brassicae TaxID=37360 RepID=A0A0G4J5W7_PLABS|nr:hypothetical protein PBRA_002726 [Plasmodiophora brassicae]SPQ94878.1 unnamed protein product [Plasmodiophora brassicae]
MSDPGGVISTDARDLLPGAKDTAPGHVPSSESWSEVCRSCRQDVDVGRSHLDDFIRQSTKLTADQRDSLLSTGGGAALLCTQDPPIMFNDNCVVVSVTELLALQRIRDDGGDRTSCICYACAALEGSSEAARQLGVLLEVGLGLSQPNLMAAAEYFALAVQSGLTPAWTDLARVYAQLSRHPSNRHAFHTLETMFRKAGDHDGTFALGRFLVEFGADNADAVAEGRGLLTNLAEQGHALSQLFVAKLALRDDRDDDAKAWLEACAKQNVAEAQTLLGSLCLQSGRNVQAMHWLERAAEQRHSAAIFQIATTIVKSSPERAKSLFRVVIDLTEDNDERIHAQCQLGLLLLPSDSAIDLLQAAADAGHFEAQTRLGLEYHRRGRDHDAKTWLDKAAQADCARCDPEALLVLARMLASSGDAGQMDDAIRYAMQAAECGLPPAMLLTAELIRGLDQGQSLQWLRRAAQLHDLAPAQTALGQCYEQGSGADGSRDIRQALQWYKKASAQSDTDAQFLLGIAYQEGRPPELLPDLATATRWLRLAAGKGHLQAQSRLGRLLLDDDTTADEGRALLRKAAGRGDVSAQADLARHLQNPSAEHAGRDDQDRQRVEHLREAASDRCITATIELAQYYQHRGQGQLARPFLITGAEDGSSECQFMLAELVLFHRGVVDGSRFVAEPPGDVNQALYFLRQAALAGHWPAQIELARLHRIGLYVDVDLDEARRWLRAGANAGCAEAAFLLAGLTDDDDEQARWLERASSLGSGDALLEQARRAPAPAKADTFWESAARAGSLEAMVEIGMAQETRLDRLHWMQVAADAGVPKAQLWFAHQALQEQKDAQTWYSWIERAADGGDPDAQHELATCQHHPHRDIWLRRAARRDCPGPSDQEANAAVDNECLGDNDVGDDDSIVSAAKAGDGDAQLTLAFRMVRAGSWGQARRWLRKSARAGVRRALTALALMHLYPVGDGRRPCKARAMSLLQEACDAGDSHAAFLMSLHCWGPDESIALLRRAADGHHPLAIAMLLAQGIPGAVSLAGGQDHAEVLYQRARSTPSDAFDLATKAARLGHARAQLLVGDLISVGSGGAPAASADRALIWYDKAAKAHLIEAQLRLASAVTDETRSVFWLEQAIAQGSRDAFVRLQDRLSDRAMVAVDKVVGVVDDASWAMVAIAERRPDDRRAPVLLKKAASLGDPKAQYLLWKRLQHDDPALLRSAADQVYAPACLDLALCHLTGTRGVDQDWVAARRLLETSADATDDANAMVLLASVYVEIAKRQPTFAASSPLFVALQWSSRAACLGDARGRSLAASIMRELVGQDKVLSEVFADHLEECRFAVVTVVHEMASALAGGCDVHSLRGVTQTVLGMIGYMKPRRRPCQRLHGRRCAVVQAVQHLSGSAIPDACLAVHLLQVASFKSGCSQAQQLLGQLYGIGDRVGLPSTSSTSPWSVFWYKRSLGSGNHDAVETRFVGSQSTQHGDHVSVTAMSAAEHSLVIDGDVEAALKQYKAAASSGNVDAMLYLANAIDAGFAGRSNAQGALKWYRRACRSGSKQAARWLASLFLAGRHVERDVATAYDYLMYARELGDDSEASKKLVSALVAEYPGVADTFSSRQERRRAARALCLVFKVRSDTGTMRPSANAPLGGTLDRSTVKKKKNRLSSTLPRLFTRDKHADMLDIRDDAAQGMTTAPTRTSANQQTRDIIHAILDMAGTTLLPVESTSSSLMSPK